MVKRTASLFNSFYSCNAKRVARLCCAFYLTLKASKERVKALLSVEIVTLGSRVSLPRLMLASYQSSLNTELEQLPIKKKKTRNLGVDLQITAYR